MILLECVLGIDIGTSGAKALIVSGDGRMIASAAVEYSLSHPRPGWAEQDPCVWWEATVKAIRQCLAKAEASSCPPGNNGSGLSVEEHIKVASVGLTGQMHGSVFLDSRGETLGNAILWCDGRTLKQCEEITEIVGKERLVDLTLNRALPGFTAPKVLWLREQAPETYSAVRKILLPKDYVRYRLTGTFATDVSDASGTLLFDVARRRWSSEVLDALDIPREWLPECFESPEVVAHVSPAAARETGLPPGTPVVAGAGDQAAGAVGNGIVRQGQASCVLGTSGVLFWSSDTPAYDREARLHSFCHAVPGKWHLMGVTLAAGGSLRWFRDALCEIEKERARLEGVDEYGLITALAEQVEPGSEGLVFLPYLSGERTPYSDPKARGAFIGLSLRHSKAHMSRSVLEGVALSLLDCMELAREVGVDTTRVYASGGGARSALWRRILADCFDAEVARVGVDEGPAYGAAILASVGVGMFDSVEDACRLLVKETGSVVNPCAERVEIYRRLHSLYRPLYSALRDFYERNTEFVSYASG